MTATQFLSLLGHNLKTKEPQRDLKLRSVVIMSPIRFCVTILKLQVCGHMEKTCALAAVSGAAVTVAAYTPLEATLSSLGLKHNH